MVYRSPYETEKQRLEKDLEKEVEEKGFPDVIITLYLSQFIYHMGDIRTRTKELGYGSGAEARTELINEVLRDAEAFQKLRDGGKSMAKLMRGKLHLNDINHDGLPDIPDINMDLVEHVLNNEKYKEVSESCADELDVMAIHSFKKNKVYLYKFDAISDKTDLVHAIAGREKEKKDGTKFSDLFLIFRGSVTLKDWIQNLKAPLVNIDIQKEKNSGKWFLVEQCTYSRIEIEKELASLLEDAIGDTPIKVHRGFLSYLFGKTNSSTPKKKDKTDESGRTKRASTNGTVSFRNVNVSKYQSIKNDLLLLFQTQRSSLYITGHSLGGALSTLAAFFLACDVEVHDNNRSFEGFKCITFASPLVGNISFQRAFDVLQNYRQDKSSRKYAAGVVRLRHLRFTNDRDLVPLSPPLSRYRHTACINVHLNLYSPPLSPSWCRIRKEEPHRDIFHRWNSDKSDKQNKRKLGLLPPTSTLSGLCSTTFPFLWVVFNTAPIILVILYLLVRPVASSLFSVSIFKEFFHAMPIQIQKSFIEFSVRVSETLSSKAIIWMSWAGWLTMAGSPNADFKRTVAVMVGAPLLGVGTLYLANEQYFDYFTENVEALFVVGMLLWQIVILPFRRADEVVSASTHGLAQYYLHIKKRGEPLSSLKKIVENNLAMKGDKAYGEDSSSKKVV